MSEELHESIESIRIQEEIDNFISISREIANLGFDKLIPENNELPAVRDDRGVFINVQMLYSLTQALFIAGEECRKAGRAEEFVAYNKVSIMVAALLEKTMTYLNI